MCQQLNVLSTLTPSSTLIETISLSTSFSASIFVSDGLAEISSIPFTITYATLVPYVVPSPDAQSAAAQTPESANQTSKSSLPILPIAAGGGGLVLVILLSISYLLYRRRRQIAVRRSLQDEKRLPPPQPNLDTELPRRGPSRTFSRLTFSAPSTGLHLLHEDDVLSFFSLPWTAGYVHLSDMLAETVISLLLFLSIFVQRSACQSSVDPSSSDAESLTNQANISSATPTLASVGAPGSGKAVPTDGIVFKSVGGLDPPLSAPTFGSVGPPTVVAPTFSGVGSGELAITATKTFSGIFITSGASDPDPPTSSGPSAEPPPPTGSTTFDPPTPPLTTSDPPTIISLPATSTSDISTTSQGVPPVDQFPTASIDPPLTDSPPTPPTFSSTFGNNVHISGSAQATLSPSTSIFTAATSYSFFTSNGHIGSTGIPILSTSITLVPVAPTQSVQASSKSSGPSTSVAIGIALGGVAVFLALILCYIINRRRHLRNRAFLRLGEEI
ncbi:hypothetical protein B0H19DRAFT_1268706 [Mycena capillaripes]|nr:hypothetical protein B0H19DRAFT_1268706 [Mycena capillaripes]